MYILLGFCKKVSGEPRMDSPPLYWLIPFCLFLSPPVETQVPNCTEFLRNDFCRDSIPNYLKIEMLLAIAATATIATAIIVIVSIKQSPFFFN